MDSENQKEDNQNVVVSTDQKTTNDSEYSWAGPEFIAYDKNSVWYFYLVITCLILCGLVYLIIKDIVTIIVIIVAFFLIALYGSRKPKQTKYSVSTRGLKVGQKSYSYGDFRNFSTVNEGQHSSLILLPLKRFALSVSLYFPSTDQEKILSIVSENLPVEQHKPDLVERLMTRIRF